MFIKNLASTSIPLPASLIAAWDFESGNLEKDSVGSADWTNRTAPNDVYVDPTKYKVGSASGLFSFARLTGMKLLDSALPVGFPLKNGTGVRKFTFCLWFYILSIDTSFDGNNIMLAKQNATYTNGPMIGIEKTGHLKYYTSNYLGTFLFSSMATGKWYHLAISHDCTTGGPVYPVYARLYDSILGTTQEYDNPAFTSSFSLNSKPLTIGQRSYFDADWEGDYAFDGNIDAVRIFNDILTSSEMDDVRNATSISGGGGGVPKDKKLIALNGFIR